MIRVIKLKKVDLEKQAAVFSVPQRPNFDVEVKVDGDGFMETTRWNGASGWGCRARLMSVARAQGRELARIFRTLSSDPDNLPAKARLCELAAIGLRSHTEMRGFYARIEMYARQKAEAQAAKDACKAARASAKLAA